MTTTDDSMNSALPTPFSSSPTPALVVRPIRFIDDVPAMRAFLELIGLRPRVESTEGLWLDLLAGAEVVGGMLLWMSRPGEALLGGLSGGA